MLRHAARGVPWPLIGAAALLVPGLLALVRYDPWTLWPLQGTAVGLLAGAVGWCLDEPAAAVVDPAPRGLAWRTLARAIGIAVLVAAWSAGIWWARTGLYGHPWAVLGQGLAATVVATTWVTWRRACGEASPGQRWALATVPATTAWALVKPLEKQVPVFPYAFGGEYGDWGVSAAGWTATGVLAGVLLVLILTREGRAWERIAS
jgi:hypothetical protein